MFRQIQHAVVTHTYQNYQNYNKKNPMVTFLFFGLQGGGVSPNKIN